METPHTRNTFDTVVIPQDEVMSRVARAMTKIGTTVATTLGPGGSNVVLDRPGAQPIVTKDGVTVFYELDNFGGTREDKVELMVYEMVRDSADKVNKLAGDGTTTIVFLIWQAILRAQKYLAIRGVDERALIKGFTEAMGEIRDHLATMVRPADTEKAIRAALNTSTNGEEEIVDTMTKVFMEIGNEGMMFIRDPQGIQTVVNYEEGFVLGVKTDAPELIPGKERLSWTDPYVAVVIDPVDSGETMLPLLEDVARRGDTNKIVLAYSRMGDHVKNWIIRNNRESEIRVLPFKIPMYAERQHMWADDIAALTDAVVIDKNEGVDISRCGIEELGRLDELQADYYGIKLIGGRGTKPDENGVSRLDRHIEFVEADRDRFTGNFHERNRMNERLAKLTGAVVSIHPGAQTEAEMKRKRGVYEDAVLSGQASVSGGVVPGGGYSLFMAAQKTHTSAGSFDRSAGRRIAVDSMGSIFRKICRDFQKRAPAISKAIKSYSTPDTCYNFKTGTIGNMFDIGVVDSYNMLDLILEELTSFMVTLMRTGSMMFYEAEEGFVTWKERHQKMSALRYR